MKKIIVLVFFLLICFSINLVMGNTSLNPTEDYTSPGINLFKAGQFNESYKIFSKAFNISPENLELNFYLGRAAFEIGRYEEAVMAFERILIALPNENRVKLELARTFHKLGSNDIARQYCNDVLLTNPPESVQRNIKTFLLNIDETEKRHFLNGRLIVGVDWDNNVWASPADGTIKTMLGNIILTGSASKETQDWITNTTMEVEHTYRLLSSNDSWKTNLVCYNADYNKTSSLDIRYLGASTGPEFISGKTRYGLKFLLSQIELGGNHYLKSTGLSAELDHILSPDLTTGCDVKFETRNYPGDSVQDADNISLLFDLSFSHQKNWYNMNLKLETQNASDDEYSYKLIGSDLSFTRVLPMNFIGSVSYEYQYSQYKRKQILFNKQRQDHQHNVGCTLKKTIWQSAKKDKSLAFNLNYRHTWAYSNIALYEYTKNLVQLSMELGF